MSNFYRSATFILIYSILASKSLQHLSRAAPPFYHEVSDFQEARWGTLGQRGARTQPYEWIKLSGSRQDSEQELKELSSMTRRTLKEDNKSKQGDEKTKEKDKDKDNTAKNQDELGVSSVSPSHPPSRNPTEGPSSSPLQRPSSRPSQGKSQFPSSRPTVLLTSKPSIPTTHPSIIITEYESSSFPSGAPISAKAMPLEESSTAEESFWGGEGTVMTDLSEEVQHTEQANADCSMSDNDGSVSKGANLSELESKQNVTIYTTKEAEDEGSGGNNNETENPKVNTGDTGLSKGNAKDNDETSGGTDDLSTPHNESEVENVSSTPVATIYDAESLQLPDFALVLKLEQYSVQVDAISMLENISIVLSSILHEMSQTFIEVLLDIQIQDREPLRKTRRLQRVEVDDAAFTQGPLYHHIVINVQGYARFFPPSLSVGRLERAIIIAFSSNHLVNLLQQGHTGSPLGSSVSCKVFLGNAAIIREGGENGYNNKTTNTNLKENGNEDMLAPITETDSGLGTLGKLLFGVTLIALATGIIVFIVASVIWRRRRLLRWEINNLKNRSLQDMGSWDEDIMETAKFPDIDLEKKSVAAASELRYSRKPGSFVIPDMSPDVELESSANNSEHFFDYKSERNSIIGSRLFPDIAWETSTAFSRRLGEDDDDAFSITDTAIAQSVYGGDH